MERVHQNTEPPNLATASDLAPEGVDRVLIRYGRGADAASIVRELDLGTSTLRTAAPEANVAAVLQPGDGSSSKSLPPSPTGRASSR